MPDLSFHVHDAEPQEFAAAPLLNFKLGIANAEAGEPIRTIALRCQIQIEATRRGYSNGDRQRLFDLFGEPERWGQTLRTMLWTHTSTVVTPFVGSTVVDLPVPCTFDFNVAAAKYFAGLDEGEVPLNLQFSGTVFYDADERGLQVAQIPWSKEARYRLPVRVWQQMMSIYYPNGVFLYLNRSTFDRLHEFKSRKGLGTFEDALDALLCDVGEGVER